MLRGDETTTKEYASCLAILKELANCSFQFGGFKDKNTLRRCS